MTHSDEIRDYDAVTMAMLFKHLIPERKKALLDTAFLWAMTDEPYQQGVTPLVRAPSHYDIILKIAQALTTENLTILAGALDDVLIEGNTPDLDSLPDSVRLAAMFFKDMADFGRENALTALRGNFKAMLQARNE